MMGRQFDESKKMIALSKLCPTNKCFPTSITPTTLLCYAVLDNDAGLLVQLVKWYVSYINDLNDQGVSALHLAAVEGNLSCIDILAKNGADVDIVDVQNTTPLEYAVRSAQFDAAALLIRRGADVMVVQNGLTVI